MRTIYTILLLLFLGVVLTFALQNQQSLTVRFASYAVSAPIAITVLGAYVLGMMSGATVAGLINQTIRRVTVRDER